MKSKIIWKEIVKDISRGMSDAELMNKHELARDQLKSIFKQLAGLRERRIQMLVRDLRSGMAPLELKRKYHLSAKGFESALKLLLEVNAITSTEFKIFKFAGDDKLARQDSRRTPRSNPIPVVTVYENGKPETRYVVRDISEKGIGVIGIRAQIGETKSLAVVGDEFGQIAPFEFEVQCRWTKHLNLNGQICSGFSVTNISEQDLFRLREFIQGFTFGTDEAGDSIVN